MTKTRGKKHTFVGMGIEITDDGRVKILMSDYISESIVSFGEDIGKRANTQQKETYLRSTKSKKHKMKTK